MSTHLQTKRHQEVAMKTLVDEKKSIEKYVYPAKVMEAEVKLCSWAVENNISFAAVDSLVTVLNSIDPESAVFSKLKLGRTKVGAVVDGVLAKTQHDQLVQKMQDHNFSLSSYESTDISTSKTLAMVVRLMDNETGQFQVCDMFYKIVEFEPTAVQSTMP